MAQAVIMPKLGQTVEEATIVRWHKKEGDKVAKGDVLFEIETDKAVLEVESFYDGVLLKAFVGEQETVPVSSTVAFIGDEGEEAPDKPPAPEPEPETVEKTPDKPPAPAEKRPSVFAEKTGPTSGAAAGETSSHAPSAKLVAEEPFPARERLFISPRAAMLAKQKAIDPSAIRGKGPNGRIVERDVQRYLESSGYSDLRITPAALQKAVGEKIDILKARGTGVDGRIMVRDVERAVAEKPRKMSKMRQIIARRLSESFASIPHFYVTVSVDMTDLLAYRRELKEEGEVYTVTDFIMESVVMALKEYPALNSVSDGATVRWHGTVDLGMAVGLDEGLVVPVIRNAEDLTMRELHDAAAELAGKARESRLMPDEMTGSTFTLSNMGMMDVENFSAIVNPGESAILAVSSTVPAPAVVNGDLAVRSMMKITLSADHRIVDGRKGAEFVNSVKSKLEDLALWRSLT